MGLKVVTDDRGVKVYRHDKESQAGNKYTTYCLGVSSKDKDGNWVNGFIDCVFKKGVEVNHKATIEIKNSFYTVNEYNGKKYVKVFILEFEILDSGEAPAAQTNVPGVNMPVDVDGFMQIPDGFDESLPFN